MAVLTSLFVPWRAAWVLHEDGDILVVDKPVGMSTHAPDPVRHDDVVSRLQRWIAARDGVKQPYLGVHQRLDRDTSGVLLFARSKEANKGLADAFETHKAQKTYLALATCRRPPPPEGTLVHDLVPIDDGLMRADAPSLRPPRNAQRAVTRFRVLERHGDRVLLSLMPETGRTHQLRVQCAAVGMPLVGDARYGGVDAPRLMLHARSLSLPHPTRGGVARFEAETPRVFERWLRGEADDTPLVERLQAAADRRLALADDASTTAFRLAHDGDGVDAAVDLYGDHALVHFYTPTPDAATLDAVMALGVRGVYAKMRPKHASVVGDERRAEVAPPHALRGEDAPEEFVITELGLRYHVRLGDGLSTGIFLDQREGRRRVRELARDAAVLNLFAYTCPFTVAAAAGGARRTVSVDASQQALDRGRRNLALNGLEGGDHSFVTADALAWLAGAKGRRERFDLVVLDPPSYATVKGSRFSAESDYKKLAVMTFAVLAPGGTMLACTNHKGIARMKFRRWLHEAAREAGCVLEKLRDVAPPVDFPAAPGAEPHLKSALAVLSSGRRAAG